MGADMLTNTFFTGNDWKQPDNLRELVAESLVSDEMLEAIWKATGDVTVEQWPGLAPDFDGESVSREATVDGLVAGLKDVFDTLDSREVSWMVWKDESGTMIRQWITGGMSWGDWPTEAGQLWYDVMDDAVAGLAPELLGKLGIYLNPFQAARALAETG